MVACHEHQRKQLLPPGSLADQALYRVKRSGRGRYDFFDGHVYETLSVISPIDGSTDAAGQSEAGEEKGENDS